MGCACIKELCCVDRRVAAAYFGGAGNGYTVGQQFLTALEYEVFVELNRVRSDPASYIPLISKKLLYLYGDTFWFPNNPVGSISQEGRPVYEEAMAFLATQQRVPPIRDTPIGMSLAARDHIADIGSKGGRGHQGQGNTTCGKRLNRYGHWRGRCSEVIAYGANAATEILLQLIVDDGVPDRSHRIHLFGAHRFYSKKYRSADAVCRRGLWLSCFLDIRLCHRNGH
eukprot:TRINITY_DN83869_c0_g1_i2.p1 TRINITY_DN83869_c0_g1~~TRINITY_DN83869_c0_g1_i2.p1  ORF type:complete len:226 (+),score=8.31 TRINITY_DN83869_c0_g1_i2:47-724(+)